MRRVPSLKAKEAKVEKKSLDNWARGVNTLMSDTKIRDDELTLGNNIILKDEGSPYRRPGTQTFGDDPSITSVQGLFSYYNSDGTNEVVLIGNGVGKKLVGDSWTNIPGVTFATNSRLSGGLINNILYLGNSVDELTKYDGTTMYRFDAISAPASGWATIGSSLTSGMYPVSYRVSAFNNISETDATSTYTVYVNKQRDNWNPTSQTINEGNSVKVRWTPVTNADGYNIFGTIAGDERFLAKVDGQTVSEWLDIGQKSPSSVFPAPNGNGTRGPIGKYIVEFKTALLIAGDPEEPSRVYFSAGVDKPESFLIGDGGGYIDISKNSSDGKISGLSLYQDKAVIFKERSVWQMDFTDSVAPTVRNIVRGIGCISHNTITPVENDLFFLGRKAGGGPAIYILGNEPNYFDVLRTNEISSRVRPTLRGLVPANYEKAYAVYSDGKYIVFYSNGSGSTNNYALSYDRERLGFTMWDSGINAECPTVFYDENSDQHIIYVDNQDMRVTEFEENLTTDKGEPILWNYKTKNFEFEDPFGYKKFLWADLRFGLVGGVVTITAWIDDNPFMYSSSIEGIGANSVFGNGHFGVAHFADVVGEGGEIAPATLRRRLPLLKQGPDAVGGNIAIEVAGSTVSSRASLLNVRVKAKLKPDRNYPRGEIIY